MVTQVLPRSEGAYSQSTYKPMPLQREIPIVNVVSARVSTMSLRTRGTLSPVTVYWHHRQTSQLRHEQNMRVPEKVVDMICQRTNRISDMR